MGPVRALRGRVNSVDYLSDERLMQYLELAEFRSAALIQTCDLRYDLISAWVERWLPETHTFHLLCGECTITLQDIALQLGFPIDESAVTSVSSIFKPTALCYNLLRRLPTEGKFMGLRFSWLKVNFEHLPSTTTEREMMYAIREYIMHIIEGVLMLNANNNKIHLMYLPLLADLHNICWYSWGSAVLAMLYR
ncbi:protein MAINTENANCE OF MERISTEMS-like [Gossypium raimondii]|uniref:protein MAINTENANCE OF MERISTEMS-like n=1 Tax=Gossypium raimondii TaxID=29730 RepID=UPI00227AF920|nr:protein MAINTENANCE OF MERISTEMS-like [Gossypium raimondii]